MRPTDGERARTAWFGANGAGLGKPRTKNFLGGPITVYLKVKMCLT